MKVDHRFAIDIDVTFPECTSIPVMEKSGKMQGKPANHREITEVLINKFPCSTINHD